jgi:hypothetical protein
LICGENRVVTKGCAHEIAISRLHVADCDIGLSTDQVGRMSRCIDQKRQGWMRLSEASQPGYQPRAGNRRAHRYANKVRAAGSPELLRTLQNLSNASSNIIMAHPRHAHFEVALMLKEVEVPILLGHGVVRGMQTLRVGHRESSTSDKIKGDGQSLLGGIKIDVLHVPRLDHSERGFEQLGSHGPCVVNGWNSEC